MSEFSGFPHQTFRQEHDGGRLSGVYGDGGKGPAAATAVVLHGPAAARRVHGAGLLPLLGEFTARGCRAFALDFCGHGESTGALRESSLRRRFEREFVSAVLTGLGEDARRTRPRGRRRPPVLAAARRPGPLPRRGEAGGPWRELGRTDLTAEVLGGRLEAYVAGRLEAYA